MRISDWSSDVCSSDLTAGPGDARHDEADARLVAPARCADDIASRACARPVVVAVVALREPGAARCDCTHPVPAGGQASRLARMDARRAGTTATARQFRFDAGARTARKLD